MKQKIVLIILSMLLLGGTIITYSNHFHNGFHFDDSHTITNNIYIRDIKNIPSFFTDMKTFGSMPENLGYRPVVTTSTAIDYWVGGGLNPVWFHMSMFIMFLLQGMFMVFLFLKIFNLSFKHQWNAYICLFTVGWYMLHPGNAETINYFISRSDSFSALFVVLGLVMYARSAICKKYWLYMIPVALGILTKEISVMFPLLLFAYVLLFEKKASLGDLFRGKKMKEAWSSLKTIAPALLLTLGVALFAQILAYRQTSNSGFIHAAAETSGYHLKYILTQPYILLTYFIQFFVPLGLSSDPDTTVFESAGDIRMWIGFLFIAFLLYLSFIASKSDKWKPVAFGFLWFLIASIPTSFLAALTQVSNSHRLFFPYIGLALAIGWAFYMFVLKIQPVFSTRTFNRTLAVIVFVMLSSYAYATWQRNEVWRTEESLWYDITQKSPGNARALMNYGLAKMSQGDYFEAEYYYRKALKLWPNWSYLHINMGILKNALGQTAEAEQYFMNAIACAGNNPEAYYYYARFLNEKGYKQKAIANLQTAIGISAAHFDSRLLLMSLYAEMGEWDQLTQLATSTLQIIPGEPHAIQYLDMAKGKKSAIDLQQEQVKSSPTPEGYLSLSIAWYQRGDYQKCIDACNEALKINPNYAEAYNNICSAYNAMGMWDKGIEACEKALKINPTFERARNNLNWAATEKAKLNKP